MNTQPTSNINLSYLCPKIKALAMIDAAKPLSPIEWYEENKNFITQEILQSGGVLLRNFDISSMSEFSRFANCFEPNLLDYTFRSTPRTKLGGKVYTSTIYPADRTIPQHNENSYTNNWPNHLLFYCAIAPTISGGETPVADSRRVYQQIDPEIVKKFEQHGVLYVRNYMPGIDLSWQEVFQTDDKKIVEEYCANNNISFSWNVDKADLQTKQVVQATLTHPKTAEKVWFNQAHLFHFSALPEEQQVVMKEEFGEQNLPRNSYYGDGSRIEPSVLEHIREVYEANKLQFPWQIGDILILDNILMTHGRNPFQGDRKISVAFG